MSENMKSIRNRITIRDEREKPYCPRTVEETEWRLLGLGDGRHLSPVQTYVHSYYSTTVQYEAPSTYSTRRMRGRTSSMNDVFMEIGGRLDRPTTDIFLCVRCCFVGPRSPCSSCCRVTCMQDLLVNVRAHGGTEKETPDLRLLRKQIHLTWDSFWGNYGITGWPVGSRGEC
jgi:hypothetical protein